MKQIIAPKWNDCLEVSEEYGPLAHNLKELSEHIREAHKALKNCQDFTDRTDVAVYSENDGRRLFAFDNTNRPYAELSMVLFNETVKPVMRVLCSAVHLKSSIDDRWNNNGEVFYHNLQNCLRFVNLDTKAAASSGVTICLPQYVTPQGEISKRSYPKWQYLGDVRKDGYTTQDLINKVNETILEVDLTKFNQGKSKTLLEDLIINPRGVALNKDRHGKAKQPDKLVERLKKNQHAHIAEVIKAERGMAVLKGNYRLISKK